MSQHWRSESLLKWGLILPALIFLLSFTIYPLFYSIAMSFYHFNISSSNLIFAGSDNYQRLFGDSFFWTAVVNTFKFTFFAVSIELVVGIVLALIVNKIGIFKNLLYSIVLIPIIISPLVVAIAWKMILNTNFGVLNFLLGTFRIGPIPWLDNQRWAMASLIAVDVWEWTPLMFIIILAGLQSISFGTYEVALVDGASAGQTFRYITLPLLKPTILIALLIRTIDSFRIFDQVFALTGGGPAHSTETLSFYIYKSALKFFDISYAATMSIIMLIFVAIICGTFIYFLKQEEII